MAYFVKNKKLKKVRKMGKMKKVKIWGFSIFVKKIIEK